MSKKIYVGNLPWSVGFEKLKEVFASYGEIEEATVISDKYSGRSKGFGFVTFVNDADADKAIAEMDGKDLEGRPLKVNEARPREDSSFDKSPEKSAEDKPAESGEKASEEKPEEDSKEQAE